MSINKFIIFLTLTLSLTSCLSRTITSGHTEILEEDIYTKLITQHNTAGLTKENLLLDLGSPEVISNIDGEKWFYLTAVSKSKSFLKPRLKHGYVMIFNFNGDKVKDIKKIEHLDPKNLNFASGRTPVKGDDTNFYKEIFGNVGKFNVNRNASLK